MLAYALVPSLAAAQSISVTGALELTQTDLPNEWRPVRLTLRSESEQVVDGFIVRPLRGPNSPATMKIPVSVPPRSVLCVVVVTKSEWGTGLG